MISPSIPSALMLVGRLDGRLRNSPARDIWLARARVGAAASIAGNAGVPVDVDDIMNWICGRSLPPRHSEGLNDPLSIAALFHYSLTASVDDRDSVSTSTLKILRTILDDRAEADLWGRDDLVRYGAAFRAAQKLLNAPYSHPTLLAVAERLQEAHRALELAPVAGQTISTVDGRQLVVDPKSFGSVWLIACHLPQALVSAGLTIGIIPAFVHLPRFLNGPSSDLATALETALGRAAYEGLAELDRVEARVGALPTALSVTKRSRLPDLLRLEIAYPGLRVPAVARLLGVTPQGASKLVALARAVKSADRDASPRFLPLSPKKEKS